MLLTIKHLLRCFIKKQMKVRFSIFLYDMIFSIRMVKKLQVTHEREGEVGRVYNWWTTLVCWSLLTISHQIRCENKLHFHLVIKKMISVSRLIIWSDFFIIIVNRQSYELINDDKTNNKYFSHVSVESLKLDPSKSIFDLTIVNE